MEKWILLGGAVASICLCGQTRAAAPERCAGQPRDPLVLDVRKLGAKGDGRTDDTAAIQAALNKAAGSGATVLVPDGTYLIDAARSLRITGELTLRMGAASILQAIPNEQTNYDVIQVNGASDVTIVGGRLQGERAEHRGSKGEWGMGISINGGRNIVIEGTAARDFWGDGFYVSGAARNVKFCSVIAENNRRQGMSIIAVDGMTVQDSTFRGTNGTSPQAGLDIEPNAGDAVNDVRILRSRFLDNRGYGIQFYQGAAGSSIRQVTIDGNIVSGNNRGGMRIIGTHGHRIVNNQIRHNKNDGIYLYGGAAGNVVSGNVLGVGNAIRDEGRNQVSGNTTLTD